jgi:hypothetical protein
MSVKSSTCRSSDASPAGPMPPCQHSTSERPATRAVKHACTRGSQQAPLARSRCCITGRCHSTRHTRTCTTTMAPTAAAACAARGEGGSPWGVILDHVPARTSNMCTSFVAPASLMPAAGAAAAAGEREPGRRASAGVQARTLSRRRSRRAAARMPHLLLALASPWACHRGSWPRSPPARWLHLQGQRTCRRTPRRSQVVVWGVATGAALRAAGTNAIMSHPTHRTG